MTEDKKRVEDTRIKDNASRVAMTILGLQGRASDFITEQESQGQKSFVNSVSFPVSSNFENLDNVLTKLGFELGEPYPDDPIFRDAKLPKGWRKVATDHSMWSKILDENNNARIAIFYKAAFYDRSSFYRIHNRFYCTGRWSEGGNSRRSIVVDSMKGPNDNPDDPHFERIIYQTEEINRDDFEGTGYYDKTHELDEQALAWLKDNYPDYRDYTAYWDGEPVPGVE